MAGKPLTFADLPRSAQRVLLAIARVDKPAAARGEVQPVTHKWLGVELKVSAAWARKATGQLERLGLVRVASGTGGRGNQATAELTEQGRAMAFGLVS